MDFYEVLDQVRDLLRRRGRVTYRVLKRQFALDDELLEDLKEEIIYAQKLAEDEENRVLVWRGESGTPPASASAPPMQPAVPEPTHPPHVEPLPEPPTPDAERRQITVMFVDVVDSTTLSGQLDPEEYRDILRAYQATCSEVIHRYDGYVAQHLGDALLVYFGYPRLARNLRKLGSPGSWQKRGGIFIVTRYAETPRTRVLQAEQN
jgi:class 3 adenylate cyclase